MSTPELQPSSTSAPLIGFAGLGAMGYGMAMNLRKEGFDVLGLDPGEPARKRYEAAGGQVTESIAESCKGRSHYFIMVATPSQVDSLMFEGEGLVHHLPLRSTVCLCCTLPPTYVSALSGRLAANSRGDIRIVDCPVSGGVVGATNGMLNIMAAGDPLAIKEVQPALQAMAAPGRIFECGGLSTASTLKMLNQHLAGVHIVSAAETLSFARALGLSTREAYEIIMKSTSSSWIFGDRGGHMLDADWATRSAVDIWVKDLGIVNDGADTVSFSCPLASQAYYAFLQASSRGHGRQDDAIVVTNYEDVIGKSVAETGCIPMLNGLDNCDSLRSVSSSVLGDSSPLTFLEKEFIKNISHQPRGRAGGCVFIYLHEQEVYKDVSADLKGLAEGSIVAVLGLRDPQEATSFAQEVVSKHPHLTFIDIQLLTGQEDPNKPEVLFSATTPESARDVQSSLQTHAHLCHPVSGPLGSATAMYLVLRLSAMIHVAAAAECYGLTRSMGLAPDLVYKIVAGAAGSSAQFNRYFPHMIAGQDTKNGHEDDRSSDNSLDQALKDLTVLQSTARTLKFPATLLNAAHQVFKAAHCQNAGTRTSITALVRCWTGREEA